MADITVRGYVNKPATRDSAKGGFSTFDLAEQVKTKEKDGTIKKGKVYYKVTNFADPTPPNESAYVTVKGWFKVRDYVTADGRKGQALEIVAQEIEVAPARDAAPKAADPTDPFGDLDAEA